MTMLFDRYHYLNGDVYTINGGRTETINITIPNNSKYLRYYAYPVSSAGYTINGKLYEIFFDNAPVIENVTHYPTLTEYGVDGAHDDITITYYKNTVIGQYQIVPTNGSLNIDNWLTYTGNPIKLNIGDTIYARGINSSNGTTSVAKYISQLDDIIDSNAYDGDLTTTVNYNDSKRINILDELSFKANQLIEKSNKVVQKELNKELSSDIQVAYFENQLFDYSDKKVKMLTR